MSIQTWVDRKYASTEANIYTGYDQLKKRKYPKRVEGRLPNISTSLILKHLQYDVRTATIHTDEEIARAAKDHKALGILSNISDFLVYQTGGVPLLYVHKLDLSAMTVQSFNVAGLVDRLDIREDQLPLFAALAGHGRHLTRFHRSLTTQPWNADFLIPLVADFIEKLGPLADEEHSGYL